MRKIIFNKKILLQTGFRYFSIYLNGSLTGITTNKYFYLDGDGIISIEASFYGTSSINDDTFTVEDVK